MRNNRGVSGPAGQADRFKCLGQGADLVELDQDGVGNALGDTFGENMGVRDKHIVPDDLDPVTESLCDDCPPIPILLGHAVFDGDNGIVVNQFLVVGDHLLGGQGLVFSRKDVLAVLEKL